MLGTLEFTGSFFCFSGNSLQAHSTGLPSIFLRAQPCVINQNQRIRKFNVLIFKLLIG